ncbi:hypothetical protein AAS21_gp045 [Pantoea phage vB_PagS_AAS21]|uniref:D2 protein n=1 Tax=Pantoea phage vB_PagS_AAS21 TaxID=2575261 RepID=A0A4Y5P1Q9_9CAUD|nr:hypothetical protein AAS21_gp045 [Pantoea phage vB_PagS_AAS21]
MYNCFINLEKETIMAPRSRVKSHQISDEKFKEAIQWLEDGKTKKGACEILGVSSNPTMERLIQEWKDEQATSAEMRKKKRGTLMTDLERANIVESYMQGDSLDEIAKRMYRSTAMVKAELERIGANLKYSEKLDESRPLELYPPMLPEAVVADSFEPGELVWVAAYQCIGEVIKLVQEDVYRIFLLSEAKQQYVHQYSWDLGSMKNFEKIGVNVRGLGRKWSKEESYPILNDALEKALKLNKEQKSRRGSSD